MHIIVPFVGLFSVDKGVLVNLFLVLCLIATNGGRGVRIAFLVAGPDFTIFLITYIKVKGVRIRISLKLLLKTAGASRPPLSGGGDIFGKETFYAINSQLTKLGLLDIPLYSPHLEFCSGC